MVVSAGSGSAAKGDIINLEETSVAAGIANSGSALTITNNSLLGNGAEVRLIATMTKTVASAKIKTRNRMHMVRVLTGQTPYAQMQHTKIFLWDVQISINFGRYMIQKAQQLILNFQNGH